MLEKLDKGVFSDDDVDLDDINSNIVTFFSDDMGLNTIDLNSINFDNNNFNDDDPETIIHVRFMAWCNRFQQRKACK